MTYLRSIESTLTDELADGESPVAGRLLYQVLRTRNLAFEPMHTGGGYFALYLAVPGGEILITDDDAQIARPAEHHSTWVACFYADNGTDEEPQEIYFGTGGLAHAEDTDACVSAVADWLTTHREALTHQIGTDLELRDATLARSASDTDSTSAFDLAI